MQPRTIILPGGAGYLGRVLTAHLVQQGRHVIILSRGPLPADTPAVRHLPWDGQTLGPWAAALDGADAVINLAGRTVNCRYTAKHKQEIYDSRLQSTAIIGQAIAAARVPPAVWLNSSSATIYRDARDRPMDEATGEIGDGFSVDVVRRWEAALDAAPTPPSVRKVALRTAIVFGPGAGGPYAAFARVVRLGLGGRMGKGDQYVSWIHHQDFCRAAEFLMQRPDLSGAFNLAAPTPIPNRDFMRAFRRALRAPIGLPAARWMLETGAFVLRTETELLLKSRRVVPARLQDAGFTFNFPTLSPALTDIAQTLNPKP